MTGEWPHDARSRRRTRRAVAGGESQSQGVNRTSLSRRRPPFCVCAARLLTPHVLPVSRHVWIVAKLGGERRNGWQERRWVPRYRCGALVPPWRRHGAGGRSPYGARRGYEAGA